MKYEEYERAQKYDLSKDELQKLQVLRRRYRQEKHVKSQWEQRHLEFMRWLVKTGRLTD
jgi:hypothetical protein